MFIIVSGSSHCASWSGSSAGSRSQSRLMLGLPAVIPPCYSSLAGVEVSSIRDRLSVLWHFSELVGQCWKMLDLHPNMVSASILLFLRKFQWFTLFIFSNFRPPKQSVLDTVWRRKGQDKKRAKNMIVGGLIASNNLPVRLFNIYVLSICHRYRVSKTWLHLG